MKSTVYLALLLAALGTSPQGECQKNTVRVPDATTALKIAEPILVKTYGRRQIDYEQPLLAKLVGDVWVISGTLCCPDAAGRRVCEPLRCAGGVAELRLRQRDGKVLSITHGK
jgi:hypothetical protein